MTDEIPNEYSAECHTQRTERREVWAFHVPAEVVKVGERLFVRAGWASDATPADNPLKGKSWKIKSIDADDRWHVRRFYFGYWRGFSEWILDEAEVFVDAWDNNIYTRGSRRHYLERNNYHAEHGIR